MCKISVVVPIYHGKHYIEPMIEQLELCRDYAEGKTDIELLLVNDAPDDPIAADHCRSKGIRATVLNTEVNRGIQGARIKGLENSTGEYILFLDQDDKIRPEYMKSQTEKIGVRDAVVCKAIHEKKPFYHLTRPFASAVSKAYMLGRENGVISPGQVLMRKEAVSEVWKKNILKHRGADDWLLWLCMMGEGRSFALNDEILFEHVVDGNNASLHAPEMQRSEWEVLEVIRRSRIFSAEEIKVLEGTVRTLSEGRIELLGKFQRMSCLYEIWISLKNQNIHMADYLKQRGYERIAIYGVTGLGKQLCLELETDGLQVLYFIDRNAPFLKEQKKVCLPEEALQKVDAVIVSLVQEDRQVADLLGKKLPAVVWTIADLLEKVRCWSRTQGKTG